MLLVQKQLRDVHNLHVLLHLDNKTVC